MDENTENMNCIFKSVNKSVQTKNPIRYGTDTT